MSAVELFVSIDTKTTTFASTDWVDINDSKSPSNIVFKVSHKDEVNLNWSSFSQYLARRDLAETNVHLHGLIGLDPNEIRPFTQAVDQTRDKIKWCIEIPLQDYLKLSSEWKEWFNSDYIEKKYERLMPNAENPCNENNHIMTWAGCHQGLGKYVKDNWNDWDLGYDESDKLSTKVIKALHNQKSATPFDIFWGSLDEHHQNCLKDIVRHPKDKKLELGLLKPFGFCEWDDAQNQWRWFSPLFREYVRYRSKVFYRLWYWWEIKESINSFAVFLKRNRETVALATVLTTAMLSALAMSFSHVLLALLIFLIPLIVFFRVWSNIDSNKNRIILLAIIVLWALFTSFDFIPTLFTGSTVIGTKDDFAQVVVDHSSWITPGDTLKLEARIFCRKACDNNNKITLEFVLKEEGAEFRPSGIQQWQGVFPQETWGSDQSDSITDLELQLIKPDELIEFSKQLNIEVGLYSLSSRNIRPVKGNVSIRIYSYIVPVRNKYLVSGFHNWGESNFSNFLFLILELISTFSWDFTSKRFVNWLFDKKEQPA